MASPLPLFPRPLEFEAVEDVLPLKAEDDVAFPPPTAPDSTDRIQLVPPPLPPRVRRPVAFPSPAAVAVVVVVVVAVVAAADVPVASSAAVPTERSQCTGMPIWKRRFRILVRQGLRRHDRTGVGGWVYSRYREVKACPFSPRKINTKYYIYMGKMRFPGWQAQQILTPSTVQTRR